MAERLRSYRAKREFPATPEPAGADGSGARAQARFVVQEHDATRLHWDLRLERDGTLASWAVPNGLPNDPARNRKAIHTEDHPLEYLDFEGVIPKGNYGAGTMKVWDRGTYECHKWRADEVIVTFHGDRLQGRYALFQTGGKDWMVHRMDPPADPAREPMPERVVPMLARPGDLPPNDEDWGFEVKWDGIRAVVYSEPGHLKLETRNLNDVTAQYPELRRLGRALGSHDAVLDGEIVAFDEQGRPSFERLQQRMHLTGDAAIRRRARDVPAAYVVFDLLYLDGRSLTGLPYEERRARLEELALEGPAWQTPAYRRGGGAALLEASAAQGLEGVVAKRLGSPYESGRRSGSWVKIKNVGGQELVIGGWLPGEGRRVERIGALLVGYYEPAETAPKKKGGGKSPAPALRYAGRVGTGFDDKELGRLAALLSPLRRTTSPFERGRLPAGAQWAEPELVAHIAFSEWTKAGMLRHPSYKGLRDDKPAREVFREAKQAAGKRRQTTDDRRQKAGRTRGGSAEGPGDRPPAGWESARTLRGGGLEVSVEGRRLKLSNLNKVLWPKAGFTKGQLIDYYRRISPVLLPHLRDRPLTLKRYPDGVEAGHFYEKQCPSHRPEWVQTAAVWSRRNKKEILFCLAQDVPTLVWTSNLADIELHTSLSVAPDVARPTMLVFDLDPGPPADIVLCCQVGLWVREVFSALGLQSFAKTSGSKGLQVYVPLNTEISYDQTKPFAKAVAELLEKQHPDVVVSRQTKELRHGKVLVDWSQNDDHKTTVCVYSLRARERPTVSTPVAWEEVEEALEAKDAERLVFDSEEALGRAEELGDLFAPVLSLQQELPAFSA